MGLKAMSKTAAASKLKHCQSSLCLNKLVSSESIPMFNGYEGQEVLHGQSLHNAEAVVEAVKMIQVESSHKKAGSGDHDQALSICLDEMHTKKAMDNSCGGYAEAAIKIEENEEEISPNMPTQEQPSLIMDKIKWRNAIVQTN